MMGVVLGLSYIIHADVILVSWLCETVLFPNLLQNLEPV